MSYLYKDKIYVKNIVTENVHYKINNNQENQSIIRLFHIKLLHPTMNKQWFSFQPRKKEKRENSNFPPFFCKLGKECRRKASRHIIHRADYRHHELVSESRQLGEICKWQYSHRRHGMLVEEIDYESFSSSSSSRRERDTRKSSCVCFLEMQRRRGPPAL